MPDSKYPAITVPLGDFSLGLRNRNFPQYDADSRLITAGKNALVSPNGVKARPGYQKIDTKHWPSEDTAILQFNFDASDYDGLSPYLAVDDSGNYEPKYYSNISTDSVYSLHLNSGARSNYGFYGDNDGASPYRECGIYIKEFDAILHNNFAVYFDFAWQHDSTSKYTMPIMNFTPTGVSSYYDRIYVQGSVDGSDVATFTIFMQHYRGFVLWNDFKSYTFTLNPFSASQWYRCKVVWDDAGYGNWTLYVNTIESWDEENETAKTFDDPTVTPAQTLDWSGADAPTASLKICPTASVTFTAIFLLVDNLKIQIDQGDNLHQEIKEFKQVRLPTIEKTYLLTQTHSAGDYFLWACREELDGSETITSFTQLLQYSKEPHRASLAALRDVVIATDGQADRPQRWSGGLTLSGNRSDWERWLGVWVTYEADGDIHDVTAEAVDTDPDTYVQVGNVVEIILVSPVPTITGIGVEVNPDYPNEYEAGDTGSPQVYYWDGYAWQSEDWVDGTEVYDMANGQVVQLATSGALIPSSGSSTAPFATKYGISGYWWRIRFSNTLKSDVRITRLTFRSEMQDLKSLGSGLSEPPLAVVYWHSSSGDDVREQTAWVVDGVEPTRAYLGSDPFGETPDPMDGSSAWYIAGTRRFNRVRIRIADESGNTNSVSATYKYWDGTDWSDNSSGFDVNDSVSSSDGSKAFQGTGILSWDLADCPDWKQTTLAGEYPPGYYLRITVSGALSQVVAISEVELWLVPDEVAKHDYVEIWQDRVALANRPDGPNQVTLSAENEEYVLTPLAEGSRAAYDFSWAVERSAHLERVGGPDPIIGLKEVQNRLFVLKPQRAYVLTGIVPGRTSFQQVEIGGNVPVNDRVIVSAPGTEEDSARHAVWWIGQNGASVLTGLSADNEYAVGRVMRLDRYVDWWDDNTVEGIYKPALHKAVGEYWPTEGWIVWAVPWTTDGSAQTSNNRLLVFDLNLGAWQTPWELSFTALGQVFHYEASAPGKLGSVGLYAGDSSGYLYRLFHKNIDTSHAGSTTAIEWEVYTGQLAFGDSFTKKSLIQVGLIGTAENGVNVSVDVFRNGSTTKDKTWTFEYLDTSGFQLVAESNRGRVPAHYYRFRIYGAGAAHINAISLKLTGIGDVFSEQNYYQKG